MDGTIRVWMSACTLARVMSDADARLGALLGVPAANRLIERLRTKVENGVPLTGTVSLPSPTIDERRHWASVFGAGESRGAVLRIDLADLTTLLSNAGLAANLAAALERIVGPVRNRRAEREATDAAWADVYERINEIVVRDPRLTEWSKVMRARGLLKRLARSSTARASAWLDAFERIWRLLPLSGEPLAQLAARTLGDAHALDAGQTVGAIVLRAIPVLAESLPTEALSPAETRRELWAAAGVLSDELSGAVLVLNLPAAPSNATGQLIQTAARAGEPLYLTLRQLLRVPPTFAEGHSRTIFICENPTVLAAAANQFGSSCAPLVCVLGHLRQSAHRLLRQLAAANWQLAYHGDFDWEGISIANFLLSRHRAVLWRMSAADYLSAPPSKVSLGEPTTIADWDASLTSAMQERRRAVFEEQVLDELLHDLQRGRHCA